MIPVIVTGVRPSVYVMLQGCAPLRATLKFVEAPAQMLAFPLIIAVGKALTVTTAPPNILLDKQ